MADGNATPGPLIEAIRNGETLEEIQWIVLQDRSLLRRRWDGDLPLHHALRNDIWIQPGLVKYLVEQNPSSVREWSMNDLENFRCLPIHLACRRRRRWTNITDDAVQVLVEAWPESAREKDGWGRLPMHEARDVGEIRILHQAYPEAVDAQDPGGMLPLHWAMKNGYEFPCVRLLMELSPRSVRAKDGRGRTPLHCITSITNGQAVQYIVEQWGDSVHQVDDNGCLPLHFASGFESNPADDFNTNSDAMQILVNCAPDTVRARTFCGFLPLQLALGWKETDVGAIRALVTAWPESIKERTPDARGGFLPIHIAARAGALNKVQFLAEASPASVRVRSKTGKLPIHLVLEHRPKAVPREIEDVRPFLDTARFLLDQFPESIMEPTTREGHMPLHVACTSGYGGQPDERQVMGILPMGNPQLQLAHEQMRQQEVGQMELEFLQYLIGLAPAVVRVASYRLLFPANYAVAAGFHTVEVTDFLFQAFPAAFLQRDTVGRNALHLSIEREKPRPEIVDYLSHMRPQMLLESDESGATPLHAAVAQSRSLSHLSRGIPDPLLEIARLLVEAGAEALGMVDQNDSLPLHVAMASPDPEVDMTSLLVEALPQSVSATNAWGQLPLHIVAENRARFALPTVTFLVETEPEGLQKPDNRGFLPVHSAVSQMEPSLPIVSFLIDQSPRTLLVADSRGFLPLHAAVSKASSCRVELVELLIKKCPLSVRRKDFQGRLPLMVAAAASTNETDLDVLFVLARAWPEAVHGKGDEAWDVAQATTPSRPRKRARSM